MNFLIFSLILLCAVFNTVAQLALKIGMDRIGHFAFSFANVVPIAWKAITSPMIFFGLATYVGSVIIWLIVLSRAPVSIAYPMSSLGYVISAVAAYYLCGENLSLIRISGILIILLGVFLVAKS